MKVPIPTAPSVMTPHAPGPIFFATAGLLRVMRGALQVIKSRLPLGTNNSVPGSMFGAANSPTSAASKLFPGQLIISSGVTP